MSNKVYKIGEIAKILGVKPSALRFWESEFSQIQPRRTENGQRYYSAKDLEILTQIHDLLHNQGLTIDGVKKNLKQQRNQNDFEKNILKQNTFQEFTNSLTETPKDMELQNKFDEMSINYIKLQENLNSLQQTIVKQEQEIKRLSYENEILKQNKSNMRENQINEKKYKEEQQYIFAELKEILNILESKN